MTTTPRGYRTVWLAIAAALLLTATAVWSLQTGERPQPTTGGEEADSVSPPEADAPQGPDTPQPFRLPASDPKDPGAALEAVASSAPEMLAHFVRIDTTNPPGNELAAAQFLSGLLQAEGIESRVLESAPGRGNVYARLPGTGDKRPVVLLSHLDVVAAESKFWSEPPYEARTREGKLYGRGVLDCKGVGTIQALAMIALKRLGVPLSRDVILLATADEETGGVAGAKWMIENHLDLFGDAEFLLNEGGWIIEEEGKPLIYALDVAEKGPCWFRIMARGTPGHGSRPSSETSVTRLVDALQKLLSWERPYRVGPVVAAYYAAYAQLEEEKARQYRQLERSLEDQEFHDSFVSDPRAAARIRDTIAPTVLSGSSKTNIIPAEAVAEVDARLLPGTGCQSFISEVAKVVAGEGVSVEAMDVAFPASQSPVNNEFTVAIEGLAREESEEAVVLSDLITGFTDSHYFRDVGIAAYGFTPLVITKEQRASIHAPDENVTVERLAPAVFRLVRLLQSIGS